jgi:hypothetical protein
MKSARKAHYPRKPDDLLPLFVDIYYEHHTTQSFDWRGPRGDASLRCVSNLGDINSNEYVSVYKPTKNWTSKQAAGLFADRPQRLDIVPRPVWALTTGPGALTYRVFRTIRKGEV